MGIKEDIEEYMGIPYDEVVKHVVNAKDDAEYRRTLWNGMYPGEVTKENVWNYYRSDQYATFIFWQAVQKQDEPAMPQMLANLMESITKGYVSDRKLFIKEPCILDYGCGNGLIDLCLKSMGFDDITLADIPHRYNRFMKFISDKYGLGFKFVPVEVWNEFPLDKKYDIIICNEVLEYVWDPEITLLHLVEHLEPFGYIYLSTSFSDMNGHAPPHPIKNNVYQDVDKWLAIVEGTGLKKAFKDENGVWKVWQKT